MEKPKSSFIKWKKLFQKDINNKNKKTSRHEKITRHDLIMLNAKVEQLEMERTISRRSSQFEEKLDKINKTRQLTKLILKLIKRWKLKRMKRSRNSDPSNN
ncbi:hypothetical protein C6P44_002982 [Monosporozyma unispora]|nr:hypothetical protein C6P44_002982 [Kazachstania unispora]